MLDTQITLKPDLAIDYLFDAHSKHEYEEYIQKAVQYIKTFLDNDCFYSGESAEMLKSRKEGISVNSQTNLSLDQALREIKDVFLDHAISFHHPHYVAHLNCPVLLPALVGDLIASSVNTAIETWDQSTSATLIEKEMIRWICNEMNFPAESDGVFTSGGTQSNFKALLMARDHYAFTHYGINLKENGWSDEVSKFRIFCSNKAHFSIKKNAALLGMGYDAVIPVETDDKMKMKVDALVQAIEKEKQRGNIPIAIVATAGTTDFGSFDPLQTISKIANEYNIWFHVDGAYGGCYVLTDTHKHMFNGVEYADSMTVDFHKTLFQPVCSSAFLVRDTKYFKYISYYADYLNPIENRDEEHPDLIEKSIQTTRRFDALKLWFTLKVTGAKNLGGFLERVHHLAREVYYIIKDDIYFEVAHKPELSTLVFRFKIPGVSDEKILDTVNLDIKNTLFNAGKASVASTKLNGKTYLKFTLLNPRTTKEDLIEVVKMIKEQGLIYATNN
ncbi:L-2,4-diaminobutyrate decarboxylase [Aquimarina sp. EL_43]|uniref:pyridoxal phosphate-dependent decarboxylase family protein n=1 Tax=unclassified Aquimarina TaxID=2627091 RepID=UPI0018CBB01A|nr:MULTISPECIES: aspartate aminotransferase family protein [unclassified Aquimarina]MBG6130213.1 L-2,4-diaminobutyrate decarboxylase [Aquimarina sp. EL_35]MBG6148993.1 L-2,4-diaminobutyrate decarboxylase [Aquimarina sp. EL_32]MBG6168633.1 L-2,4-diaminobutyrate decarboxylase [Aquimarina sp. EL_43]